ncbi:Limonene 1,2-monooxygenase [Sphingomonas paucimobilis]|nr:Limonene 1,2-monooxygenase [Sphingomonas paucimobilis]
MPIASDSYMFASYLAAKFPHMHFGFSVTSVPLHHPVRFVERINILDQLTDGKLLVGVGSGTTPEEMIGFGVDYRDAGAISEKNSPWPNSSGPRRWTIRRSRSTTARTRAGCCNGSRLRPIARDMRA